MNPRVLLSETECRFVWEASTPCAKMIPQKFMREDPEGSTKITASMGLNEIVAQTAPGVNEAHMAEHHSAPAFVPFLVAQLNVLTDEDPLLTARSGLIKVMGQAMADLTGEERHLPRVAFVLGNRSYGSYVSQYTQVAFARPEVLEHPVSFAGSSVYCLPGLERDIAFKHGALQLVCGPAFMGRDDISDTRTFAQRVKLDVVSPAGVVNWETL